MNLPEYQTLIKQLVIERGFDKENLPEKFMLLIEEVGEFAKAARKISGISTDNKSRHLQVADEAADVFWLVLDVCNQLGIDLEEAFRAKEKKNQLRKWS